MLKPSKNRWFLRLLHHSVTLTPEFLISSIPKLPKQTVPTLPAPVPLGTALGSWWNETFRPRHEVQGRAGLRNLFATEVLCKAFPRLQGLGITQVAPHRNDAGWDIWFICGLYMVYI